MHSDVAICKSNESDWTSAQASIPDRPSPVVNATVTTIRFDFDAVRLLIKGH